MSTREGRGSSNQRDVLTIVVLAIVLIALVAIVYLVWRANQRPAPVRVAAEQGMLFAGEPRATDGEALTLLVNVGYEVGYSERRKDPRWVGYHFAHVEHPVDLKRPAVPFATDTRTRAQVRTQDYNRTGYDRGHMAPSNGMGLHFGEEGMMGTFIMSNICPQRHALNAGPWERLENLEDKAYPDDFGDVWILDGPIFGDGDERLSDGVEVPRAFYKVIVENHTGVPEVLAVIMPQTAGPRDRPGGFVTTLRAVEGQSGLEFFPKLERAAKERLEDEKPSGEWRGLE